MVQISTGLGDCQFFAQIGYDCEMEIKTKKAIPWLVGGGAWEAAKLAFGEIAKDQVITPIGDWIRSQYGAFAMLAPIGEFLVEYGITVACLFVALFIYVSETWERKKAKVSPGYFRQVDLRRIAIPGKPPQKTKDAEAPLRISLTEFANMARSCGWDLRHPRTAEVRAFLNGLEQAGQDGVIEFSGAKKNFENSKTDRLIPISQAFWSGGDGYLHGHIGTWSLFDLNDTFNQQDESWKKATNNLDTYTERQLVRGTGTVKEFCNIHMNREQALRWLAVEANQYRR